MTPLDSYTENEREPARGRGWTSALTEPRGDRLRGPCARLGFGARTGVDGAAARFGVDEGRGTGALGAGDWTKAGGTSSGRGGTTCGGRPGKRPGIAAMPRATHCGGHSGHEGSEGSQLRNAKKPAARSWVENSTKADERVPLL